MSKPFPWLERCEKPRSKNPKYNKNNTYQIHFRTFLANHNNKLSSKIVQQKTIGNGHDHFFSYWSTTIHYLCFLFKSYHGRTITVLQVRSETPTNHASNDAQQISIQWDLEILWKRISHDLDTWCFVLQINGLTFKEGA